MQLIVLGMHRSGTSSVTRLLNMAGAYFGPEGISNGADEGNPKGFWERLDVREACDRLLAGGGFDWWRLSRFSLDAVPAEVRDAYVTELRRIVLDLDAHRPWVVKEPRLSLLFPLLRPLLEIPVCVHVVREPLEVAESLRTRNGFPVPAGIALWELYTVHAFRASAGLPRVLVRYDELVGAPVETTHTLVHRLRELGVDLLRLPSDREILAFITPQLHRERVARDRRGDWLNARQLRLAAAVDDGSVLDDPAVADGVSEGALDSLAELERERDRRARAEEIEAHLRQADATLEDVERRVRTIAHSRSWRLGAGLTSVRRKLRRGDTARRADPFEAVLDGLERARRDAEQGAGDEGERPPSVGEPPPPPRAGPQPAPQPPAGPRRGRPRVAVVAWDVGHNPLGRAHVLADLLRRQFDTEIWGAQFPRYGSRVWEPHRSSRIPIHVFPGRDLPAHLEQMREIAHRIDADAVYVSKPRLPSFALGVLTKQARNRPLVLDVDDDELAFFGEDRGLALHEALERRDDPTVTLPFDRLWTRVCEPLIDEADAITVSNETLRERYGGVVVPHARDERVFDPARHDRDAARRRLGVPEEARLLLFGGTPRAHKGVLEVLRALDELGDERYRLLLFSSRELDSMRAEIGGRSRWILAIPPPRFEDLPGVLVAADAACVLQEPDHPVSRHQFPAKVVDALAMRVPCLVRPVPPLRPLVERGVVGVVADGEPLAGRIGALFERYDEALDRARVGRKVFEEEYGYEAVAQVVVPRFERLLDAPPELSGRLAALAEAPGEVFATRPGRAGVVRAGPRVPGRRRRDVAPGSRYDVAVFWKQNDSGLYGRRQDMFVDYLARSGRARTIVHFDLPVTPEEIARQYVRSRGRTDQGRLVANQTLRRVLRLADRDPVHAYTYLHAGGITGRLGLRDRDGYVPWVRSVLRRHGFGECPTVLWAYPTNDDLPVLIDELDPDLVVTDVVDDHRTFAPPGTARHAAFERNYREVLARSDVVIANCEPVARSMREFGGEVHVVPNGLELPGARPRPPRPRELRGLPRPIIGYVGNLSQRIDVRLLKRVVRARPDWQFVFVGSAHHDRAVLDLDYRSNVHFVGVKRYDETLAFVEHFDVAIVPHLDNEMTRSMNPLKAFVYCSTGVPVVTTPVANLDELADLVTVADGPDAFVAAVEAALRRGRRPPDRARLAPHSWEARVARVLELVDAAAGVPPTT
ncbi:MAG: hypothetical protein KatS3mg009_1802 [Acidimicrobiia bacterium]|nr:MAG: hypothetical protein KatS3mg009_1802 [Acidimicrobiia bacterium]